MIPIRVHLDGDTSTAISQVKTPAAFDTIAQQTGIADVTRLSMNLDDIVGHYTGKWNEVMAMRLVAGIENSILGEAHLYPTGLIDQMNLNGLITIQRANVFSCKRLSDDEWVRPMHTVDQLKAIAEAFADLYQELVDKKDTMIAQAKGHAAAGRETDLLNMDWATWTAPSE